MLTFEFVNVRPTFFEEIPRRQHFAPLLSYVVDQERDAVR